MNWVDEIPWCDILVQLGKLLGLLLIWLNTSNIIIAGKWRLSTHSNIIWMWKCRWATRSNPSYNPAKNPQNKHGATRRSTQPKPKTPIKMETTSKYGATHHFPKYLNASKNFKRISWMNESLNIETHTRVLTMNPLKSRWDEWYRANRVFILTSPATEIARSVRGPKLQEPLAEDVLVESYLVQKHFGDLITTDDKILAEGCESRNNHRYAIVVQDLVTHWIQSCPCKTNFAGNWKEIAKVLGTFQGTESQLHWQFLGIRQSLRRSLVES